MNEEKQKLYQVTEQSEFLMIANKQLNETIEMLEERLAQILRLSNSKESKEGDEIDLVPLANFIRSQAWSIQVSRNKILSILDRLEL